MKEARSSYTPSVFMGFWTRGYNLAFYPFPHYPHTKKKNPACGVQFGLGHFHPGYSLACYTCNLPPQVSVSSVSRHDTFNQGSTSERTTEEIIELQTNKQTNNWNRRKSF